MTAAIPETEVHECTSCGGPVAARRKSKTGTHWCQKPTCVAMKQRFYRRHRSVAEQERLAKEQAKRDRFDLVEHALRGRPRTTCQQCSRDDAIIGFAHPTPGWGGVCLNLGERGLKAGNDWIALIWPEGAPF